ncbi:MAG: hypothetical protein KAJ55_00155 [Anaerolineales bacterium]|nr:hypothetical protein [Anaerolineales bacterium]
MNTWDDENPRPVTPLRSLVLGFLGSIVILSVGLVCGYIIGLDVGCEQFNFALEEAQAELHEVEAEMKHVGRFREFEVTYVARLQGSDRQIIQLTGPDSVKVEIER